MHVGVAELVTAEGERDALAVELPPKDRDGEAVGERDDVSESDADPEGERDTLRDTLAPKLTEGEAVGEVDAVTLTLAAGQPKPRVHVGVAEPVPGDALRLDPKDWLRDEVGETEDERDADTERERLDEPLAP